MNTEKKRKKLLVCTGGGDCPGLNAVIRGIVKAAKNTDEWDVYGSIEAFNGLIKEPTEIIKLTKKRIGGIHVKGGTILKTTNRGNPLEFPYKDEQGNWQSRDISQNLVDKFKNLGFDAMINIGGDGSQKISQALFEKGMNIIGVPKTIDNDLSATDLTFGFSTAVQIATDSFDKLVTTAESHHRVIIMEVMGRDAGWIALHTALAGGSEICLIPEIPYSVDKIIKKINKRYKKGKGFVNIVIAEGAKSVNGHVIAKEAHDGDANLKLGGVGHVLQAQLEANGCKPQVRTTILGHTQRGGTPIAFDRILGTAMGVKAFEMVEKESFGNMVAYKNHQLAEVTIEEAVKHYNHVDPDHYLIKTARKIGVSFGD
jgi:6-phosphofructokinase 1